MKLTVRALGHLHSELGFRELQLSLPSECIEIENAINVLLKEKPKLTKVFREDGDQLSISPFYLVFVNRVDIRIMMLSKELLCNDTVIDIVPVIHHG